jgi:methylglyoxal/glyoxal reductase
MALSIPNRVLNNGLTMPQLGLGIYAPGQKNEVKNAVLAALELGYRLLDTATIYANEAEVGAAIRESGLPRAEVFLTTKVWQDDMGFEATLRAFDLSLNKLQTDYVDLYLLHWPVKATRRDTWLAMEAIYATGKAKAIGVSNYYVPHLEELMEYASVVPAVNQYELHPFCHPAETLAYCHQKGIVTEGYAPVVRGMKNEHPFLQKMAQKYGRSVYQILIRWNLQKGSVPIPKSVQPDRIKANAEVFDFEIEIADMQVLDTLHDDTRVAWDPMSFL